jgi:hypothetical protein
MTQPPRDPSQPPPGWYPDPSGQQVLRWWDGLTWGQHTQPIADQMTPLPQPPPRPAPAPRQQVAATSPPKQSHWVRNIVTLIAGLIIAAIIISLLSHVSSGGSNAASTGSAPSCTSDSCIVSTIEKTLIGGVAKDNAVATKVVCTPSSVKANAGESWTASCTVTDSDGLVTQGLGNLAGSSGQVTYEPETVISGG